jgi:hypothetical protein
MDNFNFKQYLFESRVGMYSRAILNENELMDSETLGKEIAKQHPELLDLKIDGRTKEYQDSIFKHAGELLHGAGVSLQTVRGLANDEDWAMELISTVGRELKYGTREDMPGFGGTWGGLDKLSLREINPAALGAPQAAADAKMQQQDDENGDMVDNVSMDVMAEDDTNPMEAAYGNVGSVDKVAPAETGIGKYLDILHNHDWFHHFSDDPRAWSRGQADKANLKSLYSTLTPDEKQKAIDAFTDKYLSIHDPKQFPSAANNVKYLTTSTFKGAI